MAKQPAKKKVAVKKAVAKKEPTLKELRTLAKEAGVVRKKIGPATLYLGDCVEVMQLLKAERYDAVACDPPYGLAFMGKSWDAFPTNKAFQRWTRKWAKRARRVMKPGAYLLAFSGSRTYHRMTTGIEDAGLDIRDQIMWVYGSGFPKGLDVGKMIDKVERGVPQGVSDPEGPNKGKWTAKKAVKSAGPGGGLKREHDVNGFDKKGLTKEDPRVGKMSDTARRWLGFNIALKPAHEPVCVSRKPLEGTVAVNVLKHGTGAMNIGACRVGSFVNTTPSGMDRVNARNQELGYRPGAYQKGREGEASANRRYTTKGSTNFAATPGPRGGDSAGRWPANLCHDGSEEVLDLFPYSTTGAMTAAQQENGGFKGTKNAYGKGKRGGTGTYPASEGSAARFFYCAKASKRERNEGLADSKTNKHPTVKPIALCRWLLRLCTPPGGRVLDPFMGSGSMGVAAIREGFSYVGIEKDPESFRTACERIRAAVEEAKQPSKTASPRKEKNKR